MENSDNSKEAVLFVVNRKKKKDPKSAMERMGVRNTSLEWDASETFSWERGKGNLV